MSKKTTEGYLRFLLDLVDHGDFGVPALVNLADVARDELSNAQVGVVGAAASGAEAAGGS